MSIHSSSVKSCANTAIYCTFTHENPKFSRLHDGWGYSVAQLVETPHATSQKVAGSIPDGVAGILR